MRASRSRRCLDETGARRGRGWRGLIALFLAAAAGGAWGATITVNTPNDGPLTVDGNCTLREAVLRARWASGDPATNYGCGVPTAGDDTIVFTPAQVNLTEGWIQVSTTIVFQGPVIVNGSGNAGARALYVNGGPVDITLRGITFQNFDATTSLGGVIYQSAGNLTIRNSNFNNNSSQGEGGAIHFGGDTLSIDGLTEGPVVFADNEAETNGGALWVYPATGFLVTGPVQFTSNIAGQNGGAIAIGGVGGVAAVNIAGANFTLNEAHGDGDGSAYYGGGAIYVNGGGSFLELILIQECAFELNEATEGSGGAIFNVGVMTWPDTVDDLDDLHAGGILNCFFFQNKASGDDGANDGLGGAIYSHGGLAVVGSTFTENESVSHGGAITNRQSWALEEDRLRVVNSTFSDNVAGGDGGAIEIASGAGARLLQVTIADNQASSGSAIHSASNGAEAIKIGNSILSASSGSVCAGFPLDDQGGNVQFPGTTCGVSIASGDPQLQGLLPNPPPLQPTRALGATSAALGIGVPAICTTFPVFSVDQRLQPRPQGGASCDAGAYESSNADPQPGYGSNPAAPGPLNITTTVGLLGTVDVTISETGNATLNVTNVEVLPGTPELALTTATSFSILDGGPSQTVTVSCLSGSVGLYSGTLQLTHNGTASGSPSSPTSYTVNCTVNPAPEPGYGSTPSAPGPLTISTTSGVQGTANLLVSETGTATLNVSNVQIVAGGAPEITLVTPAAFTIADGAPAVTVTVACQSPTPGPYTATLRVTHNGTLASPASPTDYTVSCTVSASPEPGYGSTPSAPGPLTISTTSGVQGSANLLVSETGTATLNVSNVQIVAGGAPEITLVTPAAFTIADGAPAVTVTVACQSPTPGPYTATLRVTHNGTLASPASPTDYTVSCTVSASPEPGYGSTPSAPGPLTISTTSGVQGSANLLVSETGTATLNVSNVQIVAGGAPEITLVTPAAFTIADGAPAVTVTVACQSPTPGPYTATLRVTHNGTFAGSPSSPTDYTVSCTVTSSAAAGYGSSPAPGGGLIITTTVNVPATANVTVSETGTATLSVSAVTVTGANLTRTSPDAFTILDGGAAQQVTVQCLSATMGVFTGTLSVGHDGTNTASPATYPITCRVGTLGEPGDVDGDGRIDLLFRSQTTGAHDLWLMNDVTRTLATTTTPNGPADLNWNLVGTNDFNADGMTDLVWHHNLSGANVVWLMNGTTRITGAFTNPSVQGDPNWQMVGTGHFDGDGNPDLLWRQTLSGNIVVWLMNGLNRTTGLFTTPINLSTSWVVGGTADFDGDEKTDIVWQHVNSGQVMVWFMDGTTMTSQVDINPQLPAVKVGGWVVQAATDSNGDGWPDLVWRNVYSGRITVWHMNGVNRIDGMFTNPSLQPLDFKLVGPR